MRKSEREHPASEWGTDRQFLKWLTFQPSCLDGAFNQYIDGVGRNIACHVRRASNSGTGVKPPFSAVPMTDIQHRVQSVKGEAEVLNRFHERQFTPEEAKEWFDLQVIYQLAKWRKQCS
jgi:hypothetical protein